MTLHMQREIEKVKDRLLQLGAMVEQSVQRAVHALQQSDAGMAGAVIDNDAAIDLMEIEVEEDCLKILALHQPVAIDLRFLITVLKINNDLERVGDLAANIAERARDIAALSVPPEGINFTRMAAAVQKMLRRSLDALVNMDPAMARNVCAEDDVVDALNRENFARIVELIPRHIQHAGVYLGLLLVSRHLERIADHATNIAEDVIYMVEGQIARHGQ